MKNIAIRLPLRRLLALCLVFLLAVSGVSPRLYAAEPEQRSEKAPDSDVFSLPVAVFFMQTEARKELEMINWLRTGENAWYWDSSNSEKIYVNDLAPLEYDYELEKVAMQRAVEIAVYYGHDRPDGNQCWQTYDDYGYSYYSAGENIAAGQTSAGAVFAAWAEENEPYGGQGHRRNMLSSDFTAVGCACVYYGGYCYWVQNFGAPSKSTTKTEATDWAEIRNVLVRNEYAAQWELSDAEINVNCNVPTDILDLLYVRYQLRIVGWYSGQGTLRASTLTLDWQPEDPSIVSYENGVLTGKAPGTTTMTALSPDGGTTLTVTVHVAGDAPQEIPGDVDGSGEVDTVDAIRLAKYLVDLVELTDEQKLAADVDGDGDVAATDAIRLAKYLVGLIETLKSAPAKAATDRSKYEIESMEKEKI